jgi:RecA/RadA recombinase
MAARKAPAGRKTRRAAPGKKPAQSSESKRAVLHKIGDRSSRWQRPEKVFTNVQAVPSIFPAVDVAIGVGGIPLERFILVHGPRGGGKSQIGIGLGLSFVQAKRPFGLLEPEMTTTDEWLTELMGEGAHSAHFVGSRPESYEEAVDNTREFCNAHNGGIIVCDSIAKLVPKGLLDSIMKEGAAEKDGIDGMSGAAGRAIAALNAQWCRELTGLLNRTKCTFIAITREREAMARYGGRGPTYKVGGGTDLQYEATLQFRVKKGFPFEYKENGKVIGGRFEVQVLKTKLVDSTVEATDAFFHVSNGFGGVAVGFDRIRDVWELSKMLGAVKRFKRKGSSGFETWDGEVLAQKDEDSVIGALRAGELDFGVFEAECRRRGMVDPELVEKGGES